MSDRDYTDTKEYGDLMDHLFNGVTIYEKGFFSWVERRDSNLEKFKECALEYVERAEADVVKLRELVEALV
jgi:hypothetical protein